MPQHVLATKPPMSAQRRQNLEALKRMGVVRSDDGRFQGAIPPTQDPPPNDPGGSDPSPEAMGINQPGSPFFREGLDDPNADMGGGDDPEMIGGDPGLEVDGELGDEPLNPEAGFDLGEERRTEEQEHDWQKREADAKAEQRRLSKQQKRLNSLEESLKGRLAELDLQTAAFAELMSKFDGSKVVPVDLEAVPEVSEYRKNYPGLIKVLEAYTAPVASLMGRVDAMEQYFKDSMEGTLKTRASTVIGGVEQVYPDAKQIVATPEFVNWIKAQPQAIRQQMVSIIDHTAQHSVEDALWVLDQYHASKGAPRPQANGNAPANRRRTPGDSMPSTSGGSAGSGGPRGAQLTPLSPQEIAQYGALVAQAGQRGPKALELLKARRELTFRRR